MSNESSRHVVGYARVSTRDQDLTSQVERIQRYISDYGLIPAIEADYRKRNVKLPYLASIPIPPDILHVLITHCSYFIIILKR